MKRKSYNFFKGILVIVALFAFYKSIDILFDTWFSDNAVMLLVVSGIAVFSFLMFGFVGWNKIKKGFKNLVGL